MDTYLALDLGGTKLLIGELDDCGNILNSKKYDSVFLEQREAVSIIRASLDDYIKTVGWYDKQPVAIGVGLVGRVDTEQGIWLQIDPARTQPIALAKELSGDYGIPCYLDNDVKSATRAEMEWGYGKISKNFIYINVGTGIAAGTVVNGALVRGSHFNAGEVGHMRVGVNVGTTCCCGRNDCIETIAAGIGFDCCARLFAGTYDTRLRILEGRGYRVNVAEVFELCREGDPLCVALVDNAAEGLANLIMNMVRVSDPDTVVLGGGVVADGFMLSKVKEKLNAETMRFVTNGVVITKLKPDLVGLLGAGVVAMNK